MERVRRAVLDMLSGVLSPDGAETAARAALSVLPDPTADTVLLGKIREIVAEWEERGATWCMTRIAALLAGGGE